MGSNIHKLAASKKASGKKLILLLFVFIFIPFNKYISDYIFDNILKKFPPLTKMIYKRERVNWSVSISISVSPWINEIYALFERRALLERRPVKGEIWKKLACSSNFLFFESLQWIHRDWLKHCIVL